MRNAEVQGVAGGVACRSGGVASRVGARPATELRAALAVNGQALQAIEHLRDLRHIDGPAAAHLEALCRDFDRRLRAGADAVVFRPVPGEKGAWIVHRADEAPRVVRSTLMGLRAAHEVFQARETGRVVLTPWFAAPDALRPANSVRNGLARARDWAERDARLPALACAIAAIRVTSKTLAYRPAPTQPRIVT